MKEKLRRYWHWVLATVVFLVLVLFVSDLSLVGLVRTKTTVRRLRSEIERYEGQIREDSIFIERLKDDEFLERYARERYNMQRQNERIYIIEEDKSHK